MFSKEIVDLRAAVMWGVAAWGGGDASKATRMANVTRITDDDPRDESERGERKFIFRKALGKALSCQITTCSVDFQ